MYYLYKKKIKKSKTIKTMIQFQLLAGIVCLCLLYIALFGCKGILPYLKDCKKKKKKSIIE